MATCSATPNNSFRREGVGRVGGKVSRNSCPSNTGEKKAESESFSDTPIAADIEQPPQRSATAEPCGVTQHIHRLLYLYIQLRYERRNNRSAPFIGTTVAAPPRPPTDALPLGCANLERGNQKVDVDEERDEHQHARGVCERPSPQRPHAVDVARSPQHGRGQRDVVGRSTRVEVAREGNR